MIIINMKDQYYDEIYKQYIIDIEILPNFKTLCCIYIAKFETLYTKIV